MTSLPAPEIIAELRLLVGYLGEKSQFNWWGSAFMASTSEAFLSPIFPRTTWLAKYHGVSEAARLVHDERIGVGSNYHLYRLPDSLERSAAAAVDAVSKKDALQVSLRSLDAALVRLSNLANSGVDKAEGPVSVGDSHEDNFELPLSKVAGFYLTAFQSGVQSFPFVRGRA